jgi:hypothetical protein
MEGLIFVLNKAAGETKLADFVSSGGFHYSAAYRHDMAAGYDSGMSEVGGVKTGVPQVPGGLDSMREYEGKKPFAQFKSDFGLGAKDSIFEDFKGTSYHDASLYFQNLIRPVDDVSGEAAKSAEAAIVKINAAIADFNKPPGKVPPPNFSGNPDEPAETKHHKTNKLAESDALIRVGNFLGSSASPLETIGNLHTDLLRQIVSNTAPRQSGGWNDGLGIPPM